MMYKCFIVDDESHAIDTLKKYALDSGHLEVVGTSQNPLQAVKLINERQDIDITFLDIDMPEISGLDVADLISKHTSIIFTTAHAGYAVAGFEKNISDFMLKPISFPRFLKSLHKVMEKLRDKKLLEEPRNDTYFFVNPGIKGKMLKINFQDITHVEGMNNYIVIHTATEKNIVYLTMREMENGLSPELFIRVHKSFILSINKITSMEGNKIMMGDQEFPIGASYKERLLVKINDNVLKTYRA